MHCQVNTVDIRKDVDQVAHYFVSILGRVVAVLQTAVCNGIFRLELQSLSHRQVVAIEPPRVVLVLQQHKLAIKSAKCEIDECFAMGGIWSWE